MKDFSPSPLPPRLAGSLTDPLRGKLWRSFTSIPQTTDISKSWTRQGRLLNGRPLPRISEGLPAVPGPARIVARPPARRLFTDC